MGTPILRSLLGLATLVLIFSLAAQAGTYKVIYSFHGTDGTQPFGELIADSSGNLYGTTEFGGASGHGTVFKLTSGAGGTWTNIVLYSFTGGTDGGNPMGSLVFDTAGNLYGTTTAGGDATCVSQHGLCGVVFQLTPGVGGLWTQTVIHTFTGTDGLDPQAGLIVDSTGNLFGTTNSGGTLGRGTVFKLAPAGAFWTHTVLSNFKASNNGIEPNSLLVQDSAGNLFGTTALGGGTGCPATHGCGTVFELLPQPGGPYSSRIVHRFDGTHGAIPVGLASGSAGNLFGVTTEGGQGLCLHFQTNGCGFAFKLTPTSTGFSNQIIHSYNLKSEGPHKLAVDSSGVLYGTTQFGGIQICDQGLDYCGTVYKLTPASGGYTFSRLHIFQSGADGQWPSAGLLIDTSGNLFGTTQAGGDLNCGSSGGCGVVFEITL